MEDNPNEKKKPRFLSENREKALGKGGYKGRFLNDPPAKEDAPEAPDHLPPVTADDFLSQVTEPEDAVEATREENTVLEDAAPLEGDILTGEALPEDAQNLFPEEDLADVPPESEDFSFDSAPVSPAAETSVPDGDIPEHSLPEDGADVVLPEEYGDFTLPEDEGEAPPEEHRVLTPSDFAQQLSNPQTQDDQDFEELFTAQPEPEEPQVPVRTHPAKKGRPKRRSAEGLLGIPNILVTVVWIAITLAIGVTLGRMAWMCAADVLAFGREDHKVTVTISSTDDIDAVATKLKNANLIRYPGLFKLYASFAVDDGDIQPGIWDLNTLYDYHALVEMMSPSSQRSVITIMIPEGYSCRQIFELLQEKRVCTVESLESYAASGELEDYWFLEGRERGSKYCLEGYLFPDTYEFYTNDTAQNVLTKMLNNFDKRVDESITGQLESLNAHISKMMEGDGRSADYIASHQMTMADVITVASLIEKESASAEESYTIASVIYNRLYAWNGTPAYLNIDASVIYALGGKTDLTQEDLATQSPYNTYLNVGLTPGPITNPGLNSIKAALEPQDTGYYYYILDPATGTHHFSSTLEEHEAFREAIRG